MRTGHNTGKINKLSSKRLTIWTSVSSKLRDHKEKSQVHRLSLMAMEEFRAVMEGIKAPVHKLAHRGRQKLIHENRQKLKSIVKTIVLCGPENISLRSHRDDSKYYTSCVKESESSKNF